MTSKGVFKGLGVTIIAVVVIAIGVVALQPAGFRIVRRAAIAAPAPVVFALLSDFSVWDAWSPWAKRDPAMKRVISDPPRGKGAVYEWSGNDEVGRGRMEIVATEPPARVVIDLHFLTPFEARNITEFTLTERPGGVDVQWAMRGKNGFVGKAFGLLMDVDALVGADFERGLASLKRLAEERAGAKTRPVEGE